MIKIGEYQKLSIRREKQQGLYLADEEGNEVLLPRAFLTNDLRIGDQMEVFVYCDSNDLEIATTEKPLLTVGQFAFLKVKDVNQLGAFCAWGLSKDLFIPFRNQAVKLRPGESYVVYMYYDELSHRLVGTTKLKRFLVQIADEHLQKGQEVDLLVYAETDLGYKVVIDQKYAGLIYKNEINRPLRPGKQLKGYIKPIREDGKIDVSLFAIGHQSIEPNAQKILEKLESHNGFLPYTDKSDPDLIHATFGISKKLFKKALGALYKMKLVELRAEGVYLTKA